jgi:hypothetical protein
MGQKCRNTAVHLKGQFLCQNGGARTALCGYIVVWDKSPNLAFPPVSDIFTIDGARGYDMSNTFPVDNDRFVILKSKRNKICNSTANGINTVLVDDFIKLPRYCVSSYVKGNTSGLIANTYTGGLFVIPWRKVLESNGDDAVTLDMVSELFFAEA